MAQFVARGRLGHRPDIVMFSPYRWSTPWRRPQHLASRLAVGRSVLFVEEPVADAAVEFSELVWRAEGSVTVVHLRVPAVDRHIGFEDPAVGDLGARLFEFVGGPTPVAWLATPAALVVAQAVAPEVIVYDVMDQLVSPITAGSRTHVHHSEALAEADVIFADERSLHRSISAERPVQTYLFQNGVEVERIAWAARHRTAPKPPVAGYLGVADGRIDLDLVDGLAALLPEWEIRMPRPDAGIEWTALPQRSNLVYTESISDSDLPGILAQLHVAVIPFHPGAVVAATSGSRVLEYLAAGLPVVSARVTDIVTDYGRVVEFANDPSDFALACRRALAAGSSPAHLQPMLEWRDWDRIVTQMAGIVASVSATRRPAWSSQRSA